MQPPTLVNAQPSVSPSQIPVVNLDSDEEQDLQYDVLNLLANPPLNKSSTNQTRPEQVSPHRAEPTMTEQTTNAEPY